MAYEMLTRTGRSFWEVTSVMQNSIRKGEYEIAGNCLWELLPQYEGYLRKRFLVISAEDCYGIITKEILHLTRLEGWENLERALSLLCITKKNRDADYFVCNLMGGNLSAEMKEEELAKGLASSIERMDVIKAGLFSYGLFKKNRKHLWNTLKEIASVKNPLLLDEIEALHQANETVTKPTEETIFAAKAIVLLWTKKDVLGHPSFRHDSLLSEEKAPIIKRAEECQKVKGQYPEWAYNCHTYYGKYKLRRDVTHEIENDQKLLTPLEENLFDDCSWNGDINAGLTRWNPRKLKIPYDDGKIQPDVKYPSPEDEEDGGPEAEQIDLFQAFGNI